MKKAIPFILILLVLLLLGISIKKDERLVVKNNSTTTCDSLSYEQNLLNTKEKFSEFDLDIKILKEKKWKKIVIKNQLSALENKSYTYDPKYTPVTLIVKNKHGFRCQLSAEIKPHGDLADHFVIFKPGADTIYELPSLKVKILNGNIFGIIEFRLFIPKTRNHTNEILATTLLQELGFYAPRTTNVNISYNNKKTKYIFQEKINKEFLENNSLQEGLIFSGDERFAFKYNEDKPNSKESGISKHKLTDSKFSLKNTINTNIAVKALQILNESSFFYSSIVNQVTAVDYFSSQNKNLYGEYFLDLPKFDAILSAISATHGLSRDDRRFYYDVVKKKFIPIYYDGMVSILDSNNELIVNNHKFNLSLKNKSSKTLKSAKIGAASALESIKQIKTDKLNFLIEERGLNISRKNLIAIIEMIKNNLLIIKTIPENTIIKVSNNIEHPLKNISAIKKKINASYLFIKNEKYIKCDLLLNKCVPIDLSNKEINLALEQRLKDKNKTDLIFMGDIEKFSENNLQQTILSDNYKRIKILPNIIIRTYGNTSVDINEKTKTIEIKKSSADGKVLFLNSFLKDWKIIFEDLTISNLKIDRRDVNGLSGCINFYDSKIENIELRINKALCEDGANFVRTDGTIVKSFVNNALSDGIDLDFSNVEFHELKVDESGNDCIDFSYGKYVLNNSSLNKCGDKAISVGENSLLKIDNIKISNSSMGIASKDSSLTKLNLGNMHQVQTCVAVYKKKQEFNGGFLSIRDLVCENYDSLSNIDKYSKIAYKND
tara:strand:- start:98 stop:2422 length:2325 start_codon:yes stop_codon:yes gene_type:complete